MVIVEEEARSPERTARLGLRLADLPLDTGRGVCYTQAGRRDDMERKPALKPDMVQEFVAKSHGDLDRVKALLSQEPALVNATWDWGGGDWESGLGAASHVGRKDIALHLLAHGARLDLFAVAMLGKLELVRAVLAAFPEVRHAKGPHGIPLLDHAKAGGPEAAPVVAFLQSFQAG